MSRMFKQLLSLTLAIMFLVCLMPVSASAADVESIVLFSGSVLADTPWNFDDSSKSVQAYAAAYGGVYDPAAITEESYYTVTYTAENGESIYLVLQDWDVGGWAQITEYAVTEADGVYTATFSAASCVSAYGSSDFSTLDCVLVNSQWGAPTITSLTLHTPIASEEPSEPEEPTDATDASEETDASEAPGTDIETNGNVFSGPATVGAGWNEIVQVQTSLWNGPLDLATVTEGGYFTVYFSGESIWSISLGLNGGEGKWGQIDLDSAKFTGNDDGTYAVTFSYEDCADAFGYDISELGAVHVYGNTDADGSVTVYRVTYTPAETEEDPTDAPETPETPDAPETPETPDAPETPEASEPAGSSKELLSAPVTVGEGWQLGCRVDTTNWGGSFYAGQISQEDSFTVKLTGENLFSVHLVLQGSDGSWNQRDLEVTGMGVDADGNYVATFNCADYGMESFSGIGAIYVYVNTDVGGSATVNSFTYNTEAPADGANPSTGDTFAFWLIPVMLVSAAALVVVIGKRKQFMA